MKAFAFPLLSFVIFCLTTSISLAKNISEVPFWDGETTDPSGLLLNRFGGNPVTGISATITHVTNVVRSGRGAFRIDTNATIPINGFDFIAAALTGFGASASYIDTRDITRFEGIEFWLRNTTGSPFVLTFEIKDYRDTNAHRARRSYNIPATSEWRSISIPLDPLNNSNGWTVIGSPDLSRTKLFAFVIEANSGTAVNGSIYLDDMILIERGGNIDSQTGSIETIVDRLTERQFRGLWGSRDRVTGLVPSISSFADVSALNTTAALIKLLPVAVNVDWITQSDADDYVERVVNTLNTIMDNVNATGNGGFLPPRYIDRVTLLQNFVLEESSVDAAFMFLSLYQYQSLVTTPAALKNSIDNLLQRFNFAVFSDATGWKLAYLYQSGMFTAGTYDGYSGEVWVISLAAHLQKNAAFRVDIATHYHSAANRVKDHLIDPNRAHLVHTATAFRAPFLQWLFSLFVDVTDRTKDTYPDPALASNPHDNAVLYQLEVHAETARLNRELFLQPDAGDDGTGSIYEQFSGYNNFGQPDLFMPWSVAFSFLAEPTVAEAALRNHLFNGLHGPLGLTDSVKWTTGALLPGRVTARHDFWNIALSTMALMQYRFGENELLSSLPEIRQALDVVMLNKNIFEDEFESQNGN